MDWEELENILRSRATEDKETVLVQLMMAIGRKCDTLMAEQCESALWDGRFQAQKT